jgi:peptidoglycan/LPS O-acetylase OafA/YrhL
MTTLQTPRVGFREDINGLRAWAVLTVVLYHFGVTGFAGGFQGVDIFFVISGYLMTGIVVSGLERNHRQFSILAFYLARGKRIIPALLVVCSFVMLLGWWTLPAPDYRTLAEHSAMSVLFLSNFKYWREAGYFDAQAHEKWLLHTWSLSVEWQFYLLFPVLLWVIWRYRPGRQFLGLLLLLLLLLSLGTSVWQSVERPSSAFFLLPSRAWELLLGGLVFIYSPYVQKSDRITRQQKLIALLGFGLLVIGIVLFSGSDVWPSWHAGFPVVGASLIIWAHANLHATRSRWAQWLGDRSYSVYLWHWPIVVVLNNMELQATVWAIALGVVVSVLLGTISYALIEKRSRAFFASTNSKHAAWLLLAALFAFVSACSYVLIKKGIFGRVSQQSETLLNQRHDGNPRINECHMFKGDTSPGCIYGGPEIKAIVLGDSHATALINAVAGALPNSQSGVREYSYTACPILLGAQMIPGKLDATHACFAFVEKTIALLQKDYPTVPIVIINRWAQHAVGRNEKLSERNIPYVYFDKPVSYATPEFIKDYQDHMVSTMCSLARTRKVYALRPIPELAIDVPATLARKAIWGGEMDVILPWADYIQRQQFVLDALDRAHDQCGVEILDPTPVLCPDGACHGAQNGRALYYDDDHLSQFGNQKLVPLFRTVFAP